MSVDTGGTFTDVVATTTDGRYAAVKTPSTPEDPSIALLQGIADVAAAFDLALADVDLVLHGTTTGTNAVLEHKFEGLGLLVTEGFRHILEIARQSVPDGYGNSFFWVKPSRLVPLHLVREINERVTASGEILAAVDEAQAIESVRSLVEQGVTRIGVCLLHSYIYPDHEQRIGELLAEHFPDVYFSLSSEVLPEYREYERAMTTLIDAMVKPYVQTYLTRAHTEITEKSGETPLLIMQSNGGVVSADTAGKRPVTMLLSGPAGGVLGAVQVAEEVGLSDILTLDAGGTSTDICLVEDLTPLITTQSLVERYPVKTPMLDIATVAAGGGSIAWVGPFDSMKVGPKSAGAAPGPICYGRGGALPTVTDAAVVLGWLPSSFIGGELELDVAAASEAYRVFGDRLGLSAERAAAGVLEIAAANQVHGIRQVTTVKGRDPADYTLLAFGGSGALLAAKSCDFLGITSIIVPPYPGNLSAYGLQVSDVRRDYVRTIVRLENRSDPAEIEAAWTGLEAQGKAELAAQGVAEDAQEFARMADLRYRGEAHEVQVRLPVGLTGKVCVEEMWRAFHDEHERVYGFSYGGEQEPELVQLRLQAVGKMHRPPRLTFPSSGNGTPDETRPVYWGIDGWVDTSIYLRDEMPSGTTIAGPAIVQEYGSTVVIPPGWQARVDDLGDIWMEKP